jgi:hypothetical protein
MHPNVDRLLNAIAVLVLLASSASGGALYGDGAALSYGSTPFGPTKIAAGDIGTMTATVEWAIYAPAAFGASVALGLPVAADPSAGTEYVYAYEIFNASSGSSTLSSFSVGLYPDVITSVSNKGWLVNTGGMTPVKVEFIPVAGPIDDATNVKWSFTSAPFLAAGTHSHYLLFTSPYGPGTKMSSLAGFTATRNVALPTPVVPEPSTVLLGLIGGLSLLAIAGYRRRHKV